MLTKEEYLARAKAQLDEWQADLEALRVKAAEASDDMKESVEARMAELKARWDAGAGKRQEILDAADDKWDDLKDEAEEGWNSVTASVKEAVERVKAFFA